MTVLAFSEKVHAVKKNRINKERQPWFSDRELCSGKKNCPQPLRGCRKVCKSVSMALKPSLSQLCCFPSADMAPVLQYRERVTPFAALEGINKTLFFLVLQYRERVTPFAANDFVDVRVDGDMLQYRERVTPLCGSQEKSI